MPDDSAIDEGTGPEAPGRSRSHPRVPTLAVACAALGVLLLVVLFLRSLRSRPDGTILPETSRGEADLARPAAAGAKSSTEVVATDGFVPLFNGKDLDGWGPEFSKPNTWLVEDGILIGSGPGYNRLVSERGDVRDFHLRVRARINDGGDGGVLFRHSATSGGYQAQIRNTKDRSGSSNGSLLTTKTLVDCSDPLVVPDHWFDLDVIAEGRRIVLKVNGKTTADYTEQGPEIASGPLYLEQVGPNTKVEFRKIEIKDLSGGGTRPGRPTILAAYRAPADSPVADGVLRPGEYPDDGLDADFTEGCPLGKLIVGMGDPVLHKSVTDLSLRVRTTYTDRSLFVAVAVRDQFLDVQESDKTSHSGTTRSSCSSTATGSPMTTTFSARVRVARGRASNSSSTPPVTSSRHPGWTSPIMTGRPGRRGRPTVMSSSSRSRCA